MGNHLNHLVQSSERKFFTVALPVSVQKAAVSEMAFLDLRGKELVLSPIMARMVSDGEGGGSNGGV